jgi:putative tryptophan/tyrosine transport system substrate-binding protein
VEGKNIVIEWRSAEGKPDRIPGLVAELVRLKIDIIVTTGPTATRAAKEASDAVHDRTDLYTLLSTNLLDSKRRGQ